MYKIIIDTNVMFVLLIVLILLFILIMTLIITFRYAIKRKYDSIDKYNEKCSSEYSENMKKFKQNMISCGITNQKRPHVIFEYIKTLKDLFTNK